MTSNYLVPGGAKGEPLAIQFTDIGNAMAVTRACAETLMRQAPMTNGLLATLPEDQALAANHARSFQNAGGFGYASGAINTMKTVAISVSALLGSNTLALAQALDKDDPQSPDYKSDIKNFRFVLDAVESNVSTGQGRRNNFTRMAEMTSDLKLLAQAINDDYVRLETAMQEAKDQDLIGKLKKQQDTLQQQLAEINAKIAQGALTKLPDAIAFGFEIGGLVLGGEVVGGIAGGALSVYGFGKEMADFNDEIAETYKEQAEVGRKIAAVTTQIASDQADYATLTLIASQIKIFHLQVGKLLASMESLQSEVTDWQDSVDLLGDYTAPPSDGFYTAQVQAGERFWSRSVSLLDRLSSITVNSGVERSLLHMA